MERRDLLRMAASIGAGSVVSNLLAARTAHAEVRYESYGRGPALFLGSPLGASHARPGGDPLAALRQGYLDRLTDRYRVIAMDYPPTGADAAAAVASFDPDRVCADILAVADAAERQADLERMGWKVHVVDGFKHELFTRPDLLVPLMRTFLDPFLLRP